MNVLSVMLVGAGIVLVVLSPIFVMLVLAALGVDGFRGDKRRDVPVVRAAPVRPQVVRGPLRVASRRTDQVEAA